MTSYVALSFLLLLIPTLTCQQDPGGIMDSKLREVHLHRKTDLIFLLDNSGSIGEADFDIQLLFVKSLLIEFSISPKDTRVAVVSYNEQVTRHIDYISHDPDNKCSFLSKVKSEVKYKGGSATNIKLALQDASDIFENSQRGGEEDVKKVLILLSDGVSNTGGSPVDEAKQLRQDGVAIYTIGVGLFDRSQLQLIASTQYHFFIFYNFEDFKRLALRIRGDPKDNQFDALVDQSLCNGLCTKAGGCCHEHARCTCSLVGGRHGCVCGPGYFGLKGLHNCEECPRGTYKSNYAEVSKCTPCQPHSTTTAEGSTSLSACECLEGYFRAEDKTCKVQRCPRFVSLSNGRMRPDICENTYESECSFECNLGYELIDPANSATRRCKADGFWSGKQAQCQKVSCDEIPTPTDGSRLCLNQDEFLGDVYGSTCSFSCKDGFNEVGDRERECTESGEWSGVPFSCKAITCPTLPSLRNGYIVPAKCGEKRQKVKLACAFSCEDGYRLQGPLTKQCQTTGNWSSDEQVACVDAIPPEITCPDSIDKEAEPGLSSAEVTWDMPVYSDNLDGTDALTVTVHPAGLKPSHRFEIGSVRVRYTVTDTAGLSAECYFKVVILDKQPPTVENCPDEMHETSSDKISAVTWDEPQFTDNSKGDLILTQTHHPDVELTWGAHIVTYTATDAAGLESECRFRIRIGPSTCTNYPDPRNGARACDQWLFGSFCRVYCNQAYEFAEKPAAWYMCGRGKWTTSPFGFSIPWPDCSEKHDPSGVRLGMETQYYAGDCTNEKTRLRIREAFVDDFRKSMIGRRGGCMGENYCLVEEVTVYCGEIDEDEDEGRRRRRSADTTGLNYTVTIDFTVSTQIRSPDKGQHKAQLENATQTLEEIKGNFAKLAGAGQLHLVVDNQTLPVVEGSFSANRTVPLCQTGSMLLDTEECINCAVGSYLETAAHECRVCEEGTYQDEEGQDYCKNCPSGTWTAGTQAKDISECRTQCNPGTFSPSGLSTCKPCPIGSYQHGFKKHACIPCREGTTTSAKGTSSSRNCRAVCSPGKYSVTGLRPCKPCPMGMYQPEQHQTECLPCPDNKMTTDEGAISESECRDIDACESAPCQNGGLCVRDGASFYCGCPPGFAGSLCEIEVDECASQPCFFQATCVDQVNGFACVCVSGYEGALCAVEINECLSHPCQNEAKCRDQIARLECDCVDGFTGPFCETPPDRCASQPCLNGAVCTQTPSTFHCQCQAGYKGAKCEIDIDECYGRPCQNGASCIDLPGSYQCACVPGYEGVNCEVDINECLGHPCANGATCRDVINGYQCMCLPGTAGRLCETEMSQEFYLSFDTSSTSEFSLVERDRSELRAVTLSMWIRSSDTTNMGTPFSYAAKRTTNGSVDIIDNALTVTDCASLKIYMNGRAFYTDVAINTGYWTSLVFTWSSQVGDWSLYMNGSVAATGVGFIGEPIPGEGVFALGQEQDSLGGSFSSRESFIGDIYKMDLWDAVLSESDISTISRNCFDGHGNILAWSDFLEGLEGDTLVPQPTTDGHEIPVCTSI
ncbi:sushi, von Willebrand factor type A, EGF and pentraxin domain-containing protein 1-like [Asterias rubens]|uniref:sushi, von Willebrand factor type A, EGF and pentraxin domain-containing protein 1-like n=1 Tax=Asterias rubens TaxID=7604 RepID=UPI0014552AE8|nr:sushi, von Willebrand factor type A, EGF and pentraxin domain-containing protein 1-like [Asterias rubens]